MGWLLRFFSPGRLLFVAALIIVVYLCFSAGTNVIQSYRLASDEARLRSEVESLRRQQEQLLQIREYLRSDEYVEFMARRVFGLVLPGETLVIVEAPAPEPSGDDPADLTWWQRLFGR